jgi:hypothetical protein
MSDPLDHVHPAPFRNLSDLGVRTIETREDRQRIERNLLAAEPGFRFTHELTRSGETPGPVDWIPSTVDQKANCVGGLFPEGWTPLWAKNRPDTKYWYCRNKPRFLLNIPPVQEPVQGEMARPAAGDDSIGYMDSYQEIQTLQWYGVYEIGDVEVRRWLQRMLRIVKKGMTNRYCAVSSLTGRPTRRADKGESLWFAPGAIAWARGGVNRFLGHLFRPEDEYETYHWPLPTSGVLCNWSVTKRHAEKEAEWARLLRRKSDG